MANRQFGVKKLCGFGGPSMHRSRDTARAQWPFMWWRCAQTESSSETVYHKILKVGACVGYIKLNIWNKV